MCHVRLAMDEIHCTQDLKDALRRLRKLADRLIADRLQKKKFEHIGTLTHIFRVLGVAADRDRLPSAYLDELVSLCRVCPSTSTLWNISLTWSSGHGSRQNRLILVATTLHVYIALPTITNLTCVAER